MDNPLLINIIQAGEVSGLFDCRKIEYYEDISFFGFQTEPPSYSTAQSSTTTGKGDPPKCLELYVNQDCTFLGLEKLVTVDINRGLPYMSEPNHPPDKFEAYKLSPLDCSGNYCPLDVFPSELAPSLQPQPTLTYPNCVHGIASSELRNAYIDAQEKVMFDSTKTKGFFTTLFSRKKKKKQPSTVVA